MKNAWLIGGALAVICIALAVYYAIPGVYHPLTFSSTPTASHIKHTIVFLFLAIVAVVGARFAANSGSKAV